MRVATKTIFDMTKCRLGNLTGAMTRNSETLSSGKRINTPSDDPVGYCYVMDLDSRLSNLDQLERNINTGRTWLSTSETTLDSVREIGLEAQETALQMATDTYNETDRELAAKYVNELLQDAIALANTNVNGNYIYAGTCTETKPFELFDDAFGKRVEYAGDANDFCIKIGKNTNLQIGYNGLDIYGDSADSIFQALIDLEDALQNNDPAAVMVSYDNLQVREKSIDRAISNVGFRGKVLDVEESSIINARVAYSENKQKFQDADMIETIADFSSSETAYQAALASYSKIMNLSIIDYL